MENMVIGSSHIKDNDNKNVYIVKIHGGLGNQMFQVALMKALELKFPKFKVYGHIACMNHHNGFEVNSVFKNVTIDIVPLKLFHLLPSDSLTKKLIRKLRLKLKLKSNRNYYYEKVLGFHENVFQQHCPVYFDGYWQSEKYFESIKDEIKRIFTFPLDTMPQKIRDMKNKIESGLSCSIHVRRGDYLTWASSALGGACTDEYYRSALSQMRMKFGQITFYIFSDDRSWCKEFFNEKDCIVVDVIENQNDAFWDMYLMGLCEHHILANSSFSWWSTWLGKNGKNNHTIVPKKWFTEKVKYNFDDIVCTNWVKI